MNVELRIKTIGFDFLEFSTSLVLDIESLLLVVGEILFCLFFPCNITLLFEVMSETSSVVFLINIFGKKKNVFTKVIKCNNARKE